MRLATLFVFLICSSAQAQIGPADEPCPLGTAEATLRGVNVEAALFTNGNFFFGRTRTNGDGYVTPLAGEDAGSSPLFAANLWLGGTIAGEMKVAAARYSSFQLRPGLTGDDGVAPTLEACAQADRIWTLSELEPAAEQREDFADWPVALGAPVIDGDGITGNYDPGAGDRPAIRGDAMAFWAMTDTATDRIPNGTVPNTDPPLGADVTVEAFAFRQLPQTTFYRIEMTNRNTVPMEEAYIAWFLDWDLGGAADDYAGSDTTNQMSYVYNGNPTDPVYGVPPAAGMVVARGPLAEANGVDDDGDGQTDEPGERMGMTSAPPLYKNGFGVADPTTPEEYSNRFRGLWNDGTPVRESGNGYQQPASAPLTRFAYPGDPVTESFWSYENTDGTGTDRGAGDQRTILTTGPLNLAPGESMDAVFAIVFAQGTDRLDSVSKLKGQARAMRRIGATDAFDLRAFTYLDGFVPPEAPEITLTRPRPNPFADTATLTLTGASGARARVTVYDVLGRRLSRVQVADAPEAEVEVGAGLPAGVYVVRVEGLGFVETFTIVKAR